MAVSLIGRRVLGRGIGRYGTSRLMCSGEGPNEILAGEPKAPAPPKRVTIGEIQKMKKRRTPITMLTAYDYPSAVHADLAHVDIVLVGDSVAMVVLGHSTTQAVTMDEMIHHCKAVMRGARRPLVVGDMPFGSYETNVEEAMRNAYRFVKESGVNAVKMEGGLKIKEQVNRIVKGGIAVMGHTGLTPASISAIGQFRSFGKTAKEAIAITEDALALQDAGVFALVLECVPERVAQFVTDKLEIPTIGIGAGPSTSGQVLVYHDVLGMLQHPHHAKVTPKFVKKYASCAEFIQQGLKAYRKEVRDGTFPSQKYCPYQIPDYEWELLCSHFANTSLVLPPLVLKDNAAKSAQGSKASGGSKTSRKTTESKSRKGKKSKLNDRKNMHLHVVEDNAAKSAQTSKASGDSKTRRRETESKSEGLQASAGSKTRRRKAESKSEGLQASGGSKTRRRETESKSEGLRASGGSKTRRRKTESKSEGVQASGGSKTRRRKTESKSEGLQASRGSKTRRRKTESKSEGVQASGGSETPREETKAKSRRKKSKVIGTNFTSNDNEESLHLC